MVGGRSAAPWGFNKSFKKTIQEKVKNFNEDKNYNNPLQALTFFSICKLHKYCQVTFYSFKHIFQLFKTNRNVESFCKSIIYISKKFIFPHNRWSIVDIKIIDYSIFGIKSFTNKF